jgi:hypothetical protein
MQDCELVVSAGVGDSIAEAHSAESTVLAVETCRARLDAAAALAVPNLASCVTILVLAPIP